MRNSIKPSVKLNNFLMELKTSPTKLRSTINAIQIQITNGLKEFLNINPPNNLSKGKSLYLRTRVKRGRGLKTKKGKSNKKKTTKKNRTSRIE